MTHIFDKIMSENLSAFCKNYSTQQFLLRLTEQWRSFLDDNKYLGAILMGLSKAFDHHPHDLLIAKLSPYGLDNKVLKPLYSYVSNRKHSVRIQGYQSLLKQNCMIANPSRFHTILSVKTEQTAQVFQKKIEDQEIVSESEVELLGITIDNRLSFAAQISNLCKRAALQPNALKWLAKLLNFLQRNVLAQWFVPSNFNDKSSYLALLFSKRFSQNGTNSRKDTLVSSR